MLKMIALTVVVIAWQDAPVKEEKGPVGKRAPDFEVQDPVAGTKFSSADFKGKVVLIQWISPGECPGCNRQMAITRELLAKHEAGGLESAAFVWRGEGDRAQQVRDCVTKEKLTYHRYAQLEWSLYAKFALLDPEGIMVKGEDGQPEFRSPDVEPLMTCILDREGKVAFLAWDVQDAATLEKVLAPLLKAGTKR